MAKDLTKKMRVFADEYLKTGNIYQSAIKAGYSENYAKGNAGKLFENERVQRYIQTQLELIQSETIADVQEVLQFLTKGIRQELEEEVLMSEGIGDGMSETVVKKKKISLKDSVKCAELLGKRYGLYTDKTQIEGVIPIVISGDDNLEE